MKRRQPPRLALAALERLVPDSSSLAGDLIEEFDGRHSRAWFWWQVLAAIAIVAFRRPDEIRPLRLVDLQPVDAVQRTRRRILHFEPVNLTASPLPGIGGLGIVALSVLVALLAPVTFWALLVSIAAGVVLGIALIAMHRRRAG